MKDKTIPDSQITASSEYKHSLYHGPANARLDSKESASRTGAWSAQTNDGNQWLQVEFSKRTKVTGINTQGRNGCCSQWVTKFTVSYRDEDEDNFKDYREKGVVKASSLLLSDVDIEVSAIPLLEVKSRAVKGGGGGGGCWGRKKRLQVSDQYTLFKEQLGEIEHEALWVESGFRFGMCAVTIFFFLSLHRCSLGIVTQTQWHITL